MDEEKAQELFDLMEDEEKADVAELLPFDKDTAGGLMTTEFVAFSEESDGRAGHLRLREMAETPAMIYYLYVVEEENSWKLSGLISLRSLILADPTFPLSAVMRDQFQSAHPSDSAQEAAQIIAEYNCWHCP
jgi:Mg/Co/Ni transporter MgtE